MKSIISEKFKLDNFKYYNKNINILIDKTFLIKKRIIIYANLPHFIDKSILLKMDEKYYNKFVMLVDFKYKKIYLLNENDYFEWELTDSKVINILYKNVNNILEWNYTIHDDGYYFQAIESLWKNRYLNTINYKLIDLSLCISLNNGTKIYISKDKNKKNVMEIEI